MGQLSYYETLGVSRTEQVSAIRCAFGDLARRSYPDRTPPRGTRFYGELQLAYEVLSQGGLRQRYDLRLQGDAEAVPPVTAPGTGWALSLLEDFSGSEPSRDEVLALIRRNFSAEGTVKSGHVEILELQLGLYPAETDLALAAADYLLDIEVPVFQPCASCHGTGSDMAASCRHCDGTGLRAGCEIVTVDVAPARERDAALMCGLDALGIHNLMLCLSVELV